jgi:hypothetical protein
LEGAGVGHGEEGVEGGCRLARVAGEGRLGLLEDGLGESWTAAAVEFIGDGAGADLGRRVELLGCGGGGSESWWGGDPAAAGF